MKAISPVIATVIIVAVTIAVAIAVALWISGMTGAFTGTENLQIVTAYATANETYWNITLEIKNVGTTDATIDQIFINGKPYTAYTDITVSEVTVSGGTTKTSTTKPPLLLSAGSSKTMLIEIKKDTGFTSGQMVEVKLHTASGKEYPKMVTLP